MMVNGKIIKKKAMEYFMMQMVKRSIKVNGKMIRQTDTEYILT